MLKELARYTSEDKIGKTNKLKCIEIADSLRSKLTLLDETINKKLVNFQSEISSFDIHYNKHRLTMLNEIIGLKYVYESEINLIKDMVISEFNELGTHIEAPTEDEIIKLEYKLREYCSDHTGVDLIFVNYKNRISIIGEYKISIVVDTNKTSEITFNKKKINCRNLPSKFTFSSENLINLNIEQLLKY